MLWFEILVVIGLVVLNGLFAMSELAVVSARRARLQGLADAGNRGARTAIELQSDPTRFLSTVQVGITLIGVLAGAYSGATLAAVLGDHLTGWGLSSTTAHALAIGLVVVAITYLSLIIGELVPKRLALADAAGVAARVAPPMRLLSRLGGPLIWLLEGSTELVLRLLGRGGQPAAHVTEEEIKALVAEGAEVGVLHEAERDMIEGVLRLADRPVRAVMTPRVDVVWLDAAAGADEIREALSRRGHSRLPVCRGALDDIVGIVHARDIALAYMQDGPVKLAGLARQPLVVPEGTPVLRLIERFRATPAQMALVVDEYGSIEGIVTPADLLSAIAGAFPEGGRDFAEAVRREDGSWLVDGRMDIHQVERVLGVTGMAEGHEFSTLAGFVLWGLRRVPKVAEELAWRGWRFEVVDMDGRRIDKVLAVPPPAGSEEP
ncbi:MAG TPA: hemolysin family protein [Geminicoccaceae bacterium]|nr:hemolysin family protein [Geminicoccus sp.]HMU52767.1 hemolysin family protein [Geminicoccaceae bacterium]